MKIKDDKNGNIFLVVSIITIIAILILSIILINSFIDLSKINSNTIESETIQYALDDYKKNIAIIGYESLKEISEEVITTKVPLKDSKKEIKNRIQEKLDLKSLEYLNSQNIHITSHITNIANDEDPFYIDVTVYINAYTENSEKTNYRKTVMEKISIINLKDPLPVLKCGNDESFSYNQTHVNYGNSLANYLKLHDQKNYEYYINASSPFIIKKCIYDPYIQHGIGVTMKNCVENCYYHESADGTCYLHRLEGKGDCLDYGMETFIIPAIHTPNLQATSASDHVIFGYNSYPGTSFTFNTYDGINEVMFLDESHKSKYGLL
ncbi:MAG: hypothetical protein LBM96_01145 [Methanobrevibacter sp.]|jgi:hypothetical protein|nr:hypothetical protein [Candidatus Methanoflexus mossambicus]